MLDETQDRLRQALARARQELADLDARRTEVLDEISRLNKALDALGGDGGRSQASRTAGSRRGKYQPLTEYLERQPREPISMSFAEVEALIEQPLPSSARRHLPYWYASEGSALGRSIRAAGWRARRVDLGSETVTFSPYEERSTPW